jgi:type IV pilus biogenesis protein CpaD/CtpE
VPDVTRPAIAAILLVLLAACAAEPALKPSAPPPEPEAATPKTGVVELVVEKKERGLTRENWQDVVKGLFSTETEKNVISTRYEVNIRYDDGTSGVVTVEHKPSYQPGQRVRVVGNKVEPLRR